MPLLDINPTVAHCSKSVQRLPQWVVYSVWTVTSALVPSPLVPSPLVPCRYRAGGHQPLPAAAHLRQWHYQCLQWPGHGHHGPTHLRRRWGGLQEHDTVSDNMTRSVTTCHGQWQHDMVSDNMTWSVTTWHGQWQHDMVSDNVTWSVTTCHGQWHHVIVRDNITWSVWRCDTIIVTLSV